MKQIYKHWITNGIQIKRIMQTNKIHSRLSIPLAVFHSQKVYHLPHINKKTKKTRIENKLKHIKYWNLTILEWILQQTEPSIYSILVPQLKRETK